MEGGLPMFEAYVLVAMSGWVFDDFCGTPPRPWPGPWPWWNMWLRKVAAMVGAIIAYRMYHPNWGDGGDLVSIIIVSGIGGAFLASLVGQAGVFGRNIERPGG